MPESMLYLFYDYGNINNFGLHFKKLKQKQAKKTQAPEKLKQKSRKNSRKILETGLLANSETSKNKKLLEMLVILQV